MRCAPCRTGKNKEVRTEIRGPCHLGPAGLITAAIFLIFSFSVPIAAEMQATDSSDLGGVVRDENGTPVAGAQCRLENRSGQTYQTETDGAGRFAIRTLPPGDYKMEVRKPGFFLLNEPTIILNAGTNVRIEQIKCAG